MDWVSDKVEAYDKWALGLRAPLDVFALFIPVFLFFVCLAILLTAAICGLSWLCGVEYAYPVRIVNGQLNAF
jgi:hypothetical protein